MPNGTTLGAVKQVIREHFDAGEEIGCPACGQLVKRYRRALSAGMAYGLVLLARYDEMHPGEFVHLESHFARMTSAHRAPATVVAGGDVTKLRYWGLIEPMPGKREDGSGRLGYYRITDAGRDFVYMGTAVPSHVFLYNQKVLGWERSRVNLREALGKRFDYDDLMGYR